MAVYRKKMIVLALIIVTLLMTFNASKLYNADTAFLFEHDVQSLFHIFIFAVFAIVTRNMKLAIIAACGIELLQLFVPYRSFEIIDLISNLAGCYVAQTLFFNHFKSELQ